MNTKKFTCLFSALLLLFLLMGSPIRVFAETRNIYVGDIIALQITTREFSAEELNIKFKDFEIIEIKETAGGYEISLRTFEPGERIISLGNKEITINVQSTLDNIDRDDIFEGGTRVAEPGFSFHWRVLFYVSTGVFVLSGGFILLKIYLDKKSKKQNPYLLFLLRSSSLSVEDDNYFVNLTYYFKEYIGSLYQCRIIGKTSNEIIKELKKIQALNDMIAEMRDWLTECDRLKFTGVRVLKERKWELYEELINLAEKINTQKEETK